MKSSSTSKQSLQYSFKQQVTKPALNFPQNSQQLFEMII